jgi:hypothetical protein
MIDEKQMAAGVAAIEKTVNGKQGYCAEDLVRAVAEAVVPLQEHPVHMTTFKNLANEVAGWEVEGFIDRLTRRDGTNDERLVLEAISHLRAFARDCDALRESNRRYADEIESLRLTDAEDLLLEIANSMEKDFADPVQHVDWCMSEAKKYLAQKAARKPT